MPKILVVDDDKSLLTLVTDWLEHQHFTVDTALDGARCQKLLLSSTYDALIIDWQLPAPSPSGIDICRWFRLRGGNTPIMILTGKNEIEDKVLAFDAGADAYLTKPFELRELTARVNALTRRCLTFYSRVIKIGSLTIDPDMHTAEFAGRQLTLTATEFALLEYMGRHPSQVLSLGSLLNHVWPGEVGISPDTVRVYVKRLRTKLEEIGHRDLIQNVHGVGYKLSTDPASAQPEISCSVPQENFVLEATHPVFNFSPSQGGAYPKNAQIIPELLS